MGAAERKEIVPIPLKKLFDVIVNYTAYPEFVTGMKGARVVQEVEPGIKLIEFDLEMMKRLKYTIRISDKLNDDGKSAEIFWTLDKSDLMKKNIGRWNLRALNERETEVNYSLEVELNFPVPGFIMKGLVSNSLPAAIKEFSERAQRA